MHRDEGSVALYWIPLGAGAHSVRINGILYEAMCAAIERRSRRKLFHSVLAVTLPFGRYMIEMTPTPDRAGHERGVVAQGPVGLRPLRCLRLFRYEVRRWRDGTVPDLDFAVECPIIVSTDPVVARAVFDLVPKVPALTWGRDESQAGEMWSCNSVTSWALTAAGLEPDAIAMPPRSRAPGWDAGVTVARRALAATCPGGPAERAKGPSHVGLRPLL
jgi:hypothetical protein